MTDDLWPQFCDCESPEENNAIEIFKEQAKLLSGKTDNKVKATFSKLQYSNLSVSSALLGLAATLGEYEIIDDELKNKKDASEFFNTTSYKFEIYNDNYRFRVLVLFNRVFFPIDLEIDEGIKEELNYNTKSVQINNNAELREHIKKILSSKKLFNIIMQMMKATDIKRKP